jgi:uncharacterized protein
MSQEFEWSKSKAKDNYAKHEVNFELAKKVFSDPFGVEILDDRQDYGEDRFVILGMVGSQLLYEAYTERKDQIRIISARRTTKLEQETYLEANP